MDLPREAHAGRKRLRRVGYVIAGCVVFSILLIAFFRMTPAVPKVERSLLFVDTVKRGTMLRQVHGSGSLVPEAMLWIPALSQGRIERILVSPGTPVTPDTVLLDLSNPELELAALEARSAVQVAQADYNNLKVKIESDILTLKCAIAAVEADYRQIALQNEANLKLASQGLIDNITLQISAIREGELAKRVDLEHQRLEISSESSRAQLAAHQARLDDARATEELRKRQVDALNVRAGISGVVQQLPLEVGQWVLPGTNLAKVAEPRKLKAQIRVAENDAREVTVGQDATVDMQSEIIHGRVSRVDPAVHDRTVTVDLALDGELPQGARPDLSVDATINIDRLDNVLFVGRPAFARAHSTMRLLKLGKQGDTAVRVRVGLGRGSANVIEIVDGLREGDQVILSDTTKWDEFDRIRLK